MRARRLNSNVRRPGSVVGTPFSFWMWRIGLPERLLCRSPGVQKPVVQGVVRIPVVPKARCAGVVQRLVVRIARYAGRGYEGSLCGLPVMDNRVLCWTWFQIESRCAERGSVLRVIPDRRSLCRA
jgi:hypothetical protein